MDENGRCIEVSFPFGPDLGGRCSKLTGGCCSEVDLVLILLGLDSGWSLLTGGSYSEVISSGLTVHAIIVAVIALTRKF